MRRAAHRRPPAHRAAACRVRAGRRRRPSRMKRSMRGGQERALVPRGGAEEGEEPVEVGLHGASRVRAAHARRGRRRRLRASSWRACRAQPAQVGRPAPGSASTPPARPGARSARSPASRAAVSRCADEAVLRARVLELDRRTTWVACAAPRSSSRGRLDARTLARPPGRGSRSRRGCRGSAASSARCIAAQRRGARVPQRQHGELAAAECVHHARCHSGRTNGCGSGRRATTASQRASAQPSSTTGIAAIVAVPLREEEQHDHTQSPVRPADAAQEVDAALARLQGIVERLQDGDLHRAHRDGGWTVAEVVSHINVCTVIWLGDLQRLRDDSELRFFFREEIGHDCTGYPPPTVDIAVRQLASTRRSLGPLPARDGRRAARPHGRDPDLGTMTIAEWTPLITGHLAHHVGQALDIMQQTAEFVPEAGPGVRPAGRGWRAHLGRRMATERPQSPAPLLLQDIAKTRRPGQPAPAAEPRQDGPRSLELDEPGRRAAARRRARNASITRRLLGRGSTWPQSPGSVRRANM